MSKKKNIFLGLLLIGILAFISALVLINIKPKTVIIRIEKQDFSFQKFSSPEEFYNIVNSRQETSGYYGGIMRTTFMTTQEKSKLALESSAQVEAEGYESEGIERYSETNIQVLGIDEPDIVKTDGKNIFYSIEKFYYPVIKPLTPDYIMPPRNYERTTFVFNAFPVGGLSIKNRLNSSGSLLLSQENIVVLEGSSIKAFSKLDYEQKWSLKYNDSSLVDARMYKDKLYVVLQKYYYNLYPEKQGCFLSPIEGFSVKCVDAYYPKTNIPLDNVYFVLKINPETGEIEKTLTFLGPSDYNTKIYMSENSLFVAMHYQKTSYEITKGFIMENKDYFGTEFVSKIEKLDSYEISEYSKNTELSYLLQSYMNYLSNDERLQLENLMNDYTKKHKKDIYRTRIAKIGVNSLDFKATSDIPGKVLNQFSMDEYENYFRIAVTIGETWSSDSENAIFILNNNLDVVGETEKFGITERIYSVRFIGNKAYVVTFRETDPFYIMDLSNPEKPEIKGELKIPGYSSYLHPISENLILGIGKEGSNVKVSLFDVSNVEKPSELDKFVLSEYWSEILTTHHAFLMDKKHQIFFLPGANGGYIFSYNNDKLELKKSISLQNVKRAVYINDYLYILSDSKIVVVEENNFERVKELEFWE